MLPLGLAERDPSTQKSHGVEKFRGAHSPVPVLVQHSEGDLEHFRLDGEESGEEDVLAEGQETTA